MVKMNVTLCAKKHSYPGVFRTIFSIGIELHLQVAILGKGPGKCIYAIVNDSGHKYLCEYDKTFL